MALTDQVAALATRIGEEIKSVRSVMATDSAVVHKSGAETISGLKTFGSAPVIPAPGAAGNPVRNDDTRNTNARTPTAHTHGTDQVTAAPRTVTYAALAGMAPASGVAVDVVTCTLTGNPTITPAAGTDGQIIRLRLLAGASARTVTLASGVRLGTGITVRTLNITANQAGVIGLEFIAGLGAAAPSGSWVLFSAYATTS